jgi:hypothetical protein
MLLTLISCVFWYICSAGEKHNADRHQKWWRDVSCYRVRSSRSLPWTDAETVAGFRNWHVSWVHFSSSTPAAFSLVRHKGENENKNEREREKRPQCRRSRFQQQTNCLALICRDEVSDVNVDLHESDGVFDISASKRISDRELQNTPTIFECELGIKDTEYSRKKRIIYYPGQ